MDYQNYSGNLSNLLKLVLAEQKAKNSQFSIRALSREIGVSSGRLSEIFSGKRNLTLPVAQKLATYLRLEAADKKVIFDLVRSQKNIKVKETIERVSISSEDFDQICHYQYYALLCLIETKGYQMNLDDYANQLKIERQSVVDMLNQLERLSLIQGDGRFYKVTNISTTTSQDKIHQSIQNYHQELIKFHLKQATHVSTEFRAIESVILPFSLKRVRQAKKMIRQFVDDFQQQFGASHGSDVFSMGSPIFYGV